MLASLYIERVLKLSQDKAENFLVQAARSVYAHIGQNNAVIDDAGLKLSQLHVQVYVP